MTMSSSTALIVRDEAASTLRRAFEAGRGGVPQVVIVRGEAGIGKTRLLQEFRSEATRDITAPEPVFATGQCVDMGEIGSPYTPIRRMLRDLHSQLGDLLIDAATPTVRSALAGILPEMSTDSPATAAPGADAVADALGALLEKLSVDRHPVLFIEDLHWADTATLALLKTLAFTLRGAHLTVILTYRTDDVGRGHPLRGVLSDLERNRAVAFVDLDRLTADDAARLTRMLAPELDGDAVQQIVERSDGLPFFIEELIAFADRRLPDTLRDLLLARVETLGADARATVDLLAAGGVHVDSDLLEETADGRIERDRLHDGLREALAANILVTDGDGYAFRHALLQEAVHDDLLPSIRTELHAGYAAALDLRIAAGRHELAAGAAEHWGHARDVTRAFAAMVVARRFALATATQLVASQIAERMLASWPQVPDAEQHVGMSRLDLFAVTTQNALNDPRRAMLIARAGLAEVRPEQRSERARLLNAMSYAHSNLGDTAGARDASEEALSLIDLDDPDPDPSTRALIVDCLVSRIRTATFDVRGERVSELERMTALAIAHSDILDDRVLSARVLDTASTLEITSGRLDAALANLRRFPAFRLTERQYQINLITELDTLVRLGRFREAVALAHRRTEETPKGTDVMFGIDLNVAEALFALGDIEGGRRVARRDLATIVGPQVMSSFGWRLLSLADIWSDRPERARSLRDEHAAAIAELIADDGEEVAGWGTCTLEAALNQAEGTTDVTTRALLVDTALAGALDIARAGLEPGIGRPHVVPTARALAEATRAGVAPEDQAQLREFIDDALGRHGRDDPTAALEALVAAEATRADAESPAATVDAWRTASDLAADGFVPVRQLWYARYRLAEALLDAGERDAASALLEMIATGAPAHGIEVVARWARELAGRAGLAGTPSTGLPELTARERQVLELVAEGLTNPEIGRRLFISPKTASVHVSAILAKVGAANRTEAAAIFHRGAEGVGSPE
ncbi:DNA-binding CsgD family transcriptional regulator [Microbacterium sp. W4I4]|uniref:helix-turn-helix transcriptional regulator n=1 Tax=Microbacterium sp. W4I4 TaxID=3042295 RepID=UPI002781BD0C|nr:helix-turn-helix transcriptional regulator [Microbacterium sp. W4I4]MDQ0614875.1 DNA-binding CsgD family transcriptional regulator [Microbacterium sp. W4I4]